MNRLQLSFACWDYDRTRALMDGRVKVDGIDLNYLNLPVEETFFRMARFQEFDLAEMSLSSYCVTLNKPERPFIAIPIFPSRFFRHSCIYVNAKSGIKEPKDLIGKRIASPEYQMTAPVWIRGILSDHYGVPVDAQPYLFGGEEEPGRIEKMKLKLPPNIQVSMTVRLMRSTLLACPRPSPKETVWSSVCLKTTKKSSASITATPKFSPSCTQW